MPTTSPPATPTRTRRISFQSFSISTKALEALPTSPCHSARVLYALVTGFIPSPPPPKTLWRKWSATTSTTFSSGTTSDQVSGEKLIEIGVVENEKGGGKTKEARVLANVPPKSLSKLKRQLVDPPKARKIVTDLHRMELPPSPSNSNQDCTTHTPTTIGYSLPPLSLPVTPLPPTSATTPTTETATATATATATETETETEVPAAFTLLSIPTSLGGVGGLAGAKSGMFDLAADVSGALIRDNQIGLKAPFDSIGVFIYWWGFELSLPPSELKTLKKVQNVQSYFFNFLQAFVVAGGAPELAPFIRYLASYVDMEFAGIISQDKGNGVILAATWLIPVALVPRPWDFPLS